MSEQKLKKIVIVPTPRFRLKTCGTQTFNKGVYSLYVTELKGLRCARREPKCWRRGGAYGQ